MLRQLHVVCNGSGVEIFSRYRTGREIAPGDPPDAGSASIDSAQPPGLRQNQQCAVRQFTQDAFEGVTMKPTDRRSMSGFLRNRRQLLFGRCGGTDSPHERGAHSWRWGRLLPAVCAIALLGGCGGGGDSGAGLAALDFPVEASVAAYVQSVHQFNLSGTAGAAALTMSYRYTPGAVGVFEGAPTSTAVESADLFVNGVLTDQVIATNYFTLNPYRFRGSTSAGSYSVFNQVANLPATARIGDTGTIGTDTEYADVTKLVVLGMSDITWSLEADSGTTALFCVNVRTTSGVPADGSQCYRVQVGGAVSGLVIRVLVNGQLFTLR